MGFPFNQYFGIVDGDPYVFNYHLVLLAYLLEGHSTRQHAQESVHRHARAAYHWFAVLDLRLNDDSFMRG